MIPPWATLDGNDRAMFRATVAFLEKRLAESDTIEWALGLKPDRHIERMAVAELLNRPEGSALDEPWASAWRLIEESWFQVTVEEGPSTAIYRIQERLRHGDRSGAIVSAIANLVAPRLKVEPMSAFRWLLQKKPRRPSTFDELLLASLTSGDLIDPNVLELAQLKETPFLSALANALEAAVNHGLDIARRVGWDGKSQPGRLGSLFRVSYTQSAPRADREGEVDAWHDGIAPAVKLLHAVVARIIELDPGVALPVVQRWRLRSSPIHTRLWAAVALNSCLVSAEVVGVFLTDLDDCHFWGLREFPEIAELRALRFGELDRETQRAIAARLRKLPPRNHWPRKVDAAQVKNARLYWAARELKRIEVAGGDLPPDARSWLESRIGLFSELAEMKIDDGFPGARMVPYVPPGPDDQYDALQGSARLSALEADLSSDPDIWYGGPATRADEWLRRPGNTTLVLDDLEAVENGGDTFPSVWKFFGQAHAPEPPGAGDDLQHDLHGEAERVLRLLEKLSDGTLSAAIEGISQWLRSWGNQVIASPSGSGVWLRIWPIAVEATNTGRQPEEDAGSIEFPYSVDEGQEPMALDTLNNPSGKLVEVFLSSCPSLKDVAEPFAVGSDLRQMRDAVVGATGRSGLIARHRMIEGLRYFRRSDRDWTEEHLIAPLRVDDDASRDLWDAIARRPNQSTDVLKIIGDEMAKRATDESIRRATRQRLVFSLVVESLRAFRETREPAVPNPRIQQMLRSLDDEHRATAAGAIQRYVHNNSQETANNQTPPTAAELFLSAAAPFLRQVWPQERSLATPGVRRTFAKLPATSREAFADAVRAVERFLLPFDCPSMRDYGLYGKDDGETKLSIIDDEVKASALLRLLDLTVGTSEAAVIPHDLTDALDRIRSVAGTLVDSPEFRRLSTAARH